MSFNTTPRYATGGRTSLPRGGGWATAPPPHFAAPAMPSGSHPYRRPAGLEEGNASGRVMGMYGGVIGVNMPLCAYVPLRQPEPAQTVTIQPQQVSTVTPLGVGGAEGPGVADKTLEGLPDASLSGEETYPFLLHRATAPVPSAMDYAMLMMLCASPPASMQTANTNNLKKRWVLGFAKDVLKMPKEELRVLYSDGTRENMSYSFSHGFVDFCDRDDDDAVMIKDRIVYDCCLATAHGHRGLLSKADMSARVTQVADALQVERSSAACVLAHVFSPTTSVPDNVNVKSWTKELAEDDFALIFEENFPQPGTVVYLAGSEGSWQLYFAKSSDNHIDPSEIQFSKVRDKSGQSTPIPGEIGLRSVRVFIVKDEFLKNIPKRLCLPDEALSPLDAAHLIYMLQPPKAEAKPPPTDRNPQYASDASIRKFVIPFLDEISDDQKLAEKRAEVSEEVGALQAKLADARRAHESAKLDVAAAKLKVEEAKTQQERAERAYMSNDPAGAAKDDLLTAVHTLSKILSERKGLSSSELCAKVWLRLRDIRLELLATYPNDPDVAEAFASAFGEGGLSRADSIPNMIPDREAFAQPHMMPLPSFASASTYLNANQVPHASYSAAAPAFRYDFM